MAYLVLARKYRPQTFDEVVGQEHVTRTLKNAVSGGRVAHAILFSGPRGTGKTTIARILAKAMNCESGPTPSPCNTCRSCTDITAGRGVDVFEIDGASNNSVDQVRELRENVRYMPAHSRYKIYIIDEVHMLSIAAFNALLKTLEEPPAHIMFYFATTEVHKIPITILSRCQRHDLKRIDPTAISQQMEVLCQREAVSISAGNLWAIAREAGGSMRDALSLLDQVLACSDGQGGQMDENFVLSLLGGIDRKALFDLSEAVFARDISRILTVIDSVFNTGQDLKRFYADVVMHFRHLMLIKMNVRTDLLVDLTPTDIEVLTRQVDGVSIAFVDQVFTQLFNAEVSVRQAAQPRLAIEMAFFKIQQVTPALPIDLLIDRLDRLLQDSEMKPVAGIVEAQSTYEKAAVQPTDQLDRQPTSDDRVGAGKAVRNDSSGDPKPDRSGLHEGDADVWHRVIAMIAKTKPSIAAALSRAQSISVTQSAITVALRDNDYTVNLLNKHLDKIKAVCREHTGREIHIDISNDDASDSHAPSTKHRVDRIKQELLNHPLVADAVDIFSGKIEELKIR